MCALTRAPRLVESSVTPGPDTAPTKTPTLPPTPTHTPVLSVRILPPAQQSIFARELSHLHWPFLAIWGLLFPTCSPSCPAKSRVSSCSAFSLSMTQREVLNLLCFCCSSHLSDHLFRGCRYSTSQRGDLKSSDSLFTAKAARATASPQPALSACQQVAECPSFPGSFITDSQGVHRAAAGPACAFSLLYTSQRGAFGSGVELITFLFPAGSHCHLERLLSLPAPSPFPPSVGTYSNVFVFASAGC